MADSIQENLLGYLLDALEDDERRMIDQRLAEDAALRQELENVRAMLEPLHSTPREYAPPAGLASRTLQFVETHSVPMSAASPGVAARPSSDTRPVPHRQREHHFRSIHGDSRPTGESGSWRLIDLTAMIGVAALLMAMVVPAVHNSRFHSRIATCQDNLRQVGQKLVEYSDLNDGHFPEIPTEGNLAVAGVYGPTLNDSRMLPEPSILLCPDSAQAGMQGFTVPSRQEVLAMRPGAQLQQAQHNMGGSYAYTMGHLDNGRYQSPRNESRSTSPVLSDAPARGDRGLQASHHGGIGQNVLFEDGHVRFVSTPNLPRGRQSADHLFLNDSGVIAAGNSRNDAVLGASHRTPLRLVGNR